MIVGIDLGTTNSAVAVWRNGVAELIPNALGDVLTPSAISVADDGSVLIGSAARERQSTEPTRTATAFKRYMGTERRMMLGAIHANAEDLSALVLRSLKADAEAFLGDTVTGAVITVPAYFNDRQRKATQRAGDLAGLQVKRLLNEPTAAALAFGLQTREAREPFLVFDLGGGTFDVSVVEMFDGIVEVRASAGDNRLGGEDFNASLAAMMRSRIDPDGRFARHDARLVEERLLVAAERARRLLTSQDTALFAVTIGDERFEGIVSTEEFEAQVAPLLARLRDPVVRALRDGGLRAEALSEIVLVGGATRMPAVRRAITKMFGRFPSHAVHPDHAVALGAAMQAGLLQRDAALEEIRLSDVCPFTLGINVAERDAQGRFHSGLYSPVIERNTPIPASRENRYSTMADNQREIVMDVFQGEARLVADNVKIGTVSVPVPPRPAGGVEVKVRFSYDTSGLLEVDVSVPLTGVTRNLVIVDEIDSPDAATIAARRESLAALKVHPRDQAENALLLERAARCYEDHIGDARIQIGQWVTAFEAALDDQRPRAISEARQQLSAELDQLDGERIL
ncbi:molecular chaperone HscC [Sphingomonas sp. AP4-R1]|uniref:Hsp70 family protein n=1 Tax=Sphingomonas sp. AP4-R1 TaxID=2735134 RepID=UPI001493455E|nr:molecular chaperone HscC [Sphingomonas sp. AP4-R1]QJU57714.1 molecular chaperone HscC [Sphingomonas sp. AP4-R1]